MALACCGGCAGSISLAALVERGPIDHAPRATDHMTRQAAVALALEAELALRNGRADEACAAFALALKEEALDAGLWARSAVAHVACLQMEAAKQAATRALSLDSKLCEAWQAAVLVLASDHQPERAAVARSHGDELCPKEGAGTTSKILHTPSW